MSKYFYTYYKNKILVDLQNIIISVLIDKWYINY